MPSPRERPSLVDRAREHFLLPAAEARARARNDASRAAARDALAVAIDHRTRGEIAWVTGSPALAVAFVRRSFEITSDALAKATTPTADPVVESARAEMTTHPAPARDADVGPSDAVSFALVVEAQRRLCPALSDASMGPRDVRRTRIRRIACASLVAIAFLAIVLWSWRGTVFADASATFSEKYAATNAIDGRVETEWVLPDRTLGYVDVSFSHPRTVRGVRVVNVRNAPYFDRATGEFAIEAWRSGQVVRAVDGAFGEASRSVEWRSIDLGSALEVDRIRFVVKSYSLSGGGLAELKID